MFKKRAPKGNVRKREDGASGDAEAEVSSAVVRDEGPARKRVNAFSTGGVSGECSKTELATLLAESSEGANKHEYGGTATAQNEIDTAVDRDARAILERAVALQQEEGATVGADGEKLYLGQAAYNKNVKDAQIGNAKHSGTQGPVRAPAFFRATCRFDYQPDICKDYKDTGFCGFGDSCKFMHDRGNYKSGWQMEKEWEAQEARRKQMVAMGVDPDEEEGGGEGDGGAFAVTARDVMPFACHLCRGPFVNPVRTQCGHYFCERCAVGRYQSGTAACNVCGKNTAGLFNACRKLYAHAAKRGGFEKLFKEETALAEGAGLDTEVNGSSAAGSKKSTNNDDESFDGFDEKKSGAAEVATPAARAAALAAAAASATGARSSTFSAPSAGGAWAVVEEAEEEGVAALLEAEAEKKAEADAADALKAQEAADAAAAVEANQAAEVARENEAKEAMAAAARNLGWVEVVAHGQRYWHHAARNCTSRAPPPEVLAALNATNPGGSGSAGDGSSDSTGAMVPPGGAITSAVPAPTLGASATSTSGWVAQKDPATGYTYYFHPVTRETSWEPR